MTILSEAIESLKRQIVERIADDASTPCLLSFERAQAVLIALAEPEQEPISLNNGRLTQYPDGSIGVGTPAEPEQEPCAMRYDFDGYGYKYIDSGSGSNWQTRHKDAEPLFTAPTPRRPLTDEMVKRMKEVCTSMEMRGAFADGWLSAEAAHGITGDQT